ncbi:MULTISPECIES: efflux RND transporter periplasmic adaptor subunit [Stappiaceae]|nr:MULTISPECIES: efflux RND transporter periplasmic adaptor subunit [Stappiaceae]MEC9404195.1 efflux RND transporter periplasmic adaptor subunit [Pseudomonadota bacterium]MEC9422580.1 efflux RND transporter periplasmic adaptor subunit [Pseudomonadota bacterium]MEC9469902.1 efflux RND transporter periplasmic adaptor subunit [Pseudomonadota bacterium]MEE2867703.1 efflux RND transporter periplasmic adaptor subunit [Pseudomonadota bacterium]UFI06094.1 efflux RND transporter periplasmic adaptor sub
MRGAAPKPEVGVVELEPESVAITAKLSGRIAASLDAEVRPEVGGIIKERLFKEGTEVTAGDVLYRIEDDLYKAAHDSAQAALQKAEAALPSAQTKVERYEELITQNAVAKQELDDAKAALAQAKADIASAKASVQTARINLDNTVIKAPISGRIEASTLNVGALVTASQSAPLTIIRQLDPINVDVTQSSTNLLKLRKAVREGRIKLSGDNVQVRLLLETGEEYSETGKLEFSEAHVDPTTGTYTLRAEFPNPDRLLLPGMYVQAIVEEGIAQNSFLVPQRAVSRNARGEPTALFLDQDGKVEERVLRVEGDIGNNWLVNEGISEGDRVIVEGSLFVRAGQEATGTLVTIDEATGEVESRGEAVSNTSETSD